jgi:hypothetical protein
MWEEGWRGFWIRVVQGAELRGDGENEKNVEWTEELKR